MAMNAPPTSGSSSCRLSSEGAAKRSVKCHTLKDRFQYLHIAWDPRFKITFQKLRDYATGQLRPKTNTKIVCACQILSVCYCRGILPISEATQTTSCQNSTAHLHQLHLPSNNFSRSSIWRWSCSLSFHRSWVQTKKLPKDATNSEHVQNRWQKCKQK